MFEINEKFWFGLSFILIASFSAIIYHIYNRFIRKNQSTYQASSSITTPIQIESKIKSKSLPKPSKLSKEALKFENNQNLLTQLRGHTENINSIAFSPDSQLLASADDGRNLRIWSLKSINNSKTNSRFRLIKLEEDSATTICFSPLGHNLLVALEQSRSIVIFELNDQDPPGLIKKNTINTEHKKSIKSIQISSNGNFILSCSEETIVYLYSKQGSKLAELNSNQLRNFAFSISSDSKFVAIAAFTPDSRIFEILTKNQSFEKVSKAMTLSKNSHKAAIHAISFSKDNRKVITFSMDKTIKIWNIDVRYKMDEDPKCLLTIEIPLNKTIDGLFVISNNHFIAVFDRNLVFYEIESGKLLETIETQHNGSISSVSISNDSKLIATASFDHSIKLWKNPIIEN